MRKSIGPFNFGDDRFARLSTLPLEKCHDDCANGIITENHSTFNNKLHLPWQMFPFSNDDPSTKEKTTTNDLQMVAMLLTALHFDPCSCQSFAREKSFRISF